MKDGDWTYEISGRDLAYFRRIQLQQRKDHDKEVRESKLTSTQKYRHMEKKNGHMNPNIRPNTVSSILQKFHRKDKDQDE